MPCVPYLGDVWGLRTYSVQCKVLIKPNPRVVYLPVLSLLFPDPLHDYSAVVIMSVPEPQWEKRVLSTDARTVYTRYVSLLLGRVRPFIDFCRPLLGSELLTDQMMRRQEV